MLKISLKFNNAVLKEIESDQDKITIGRDADNDIQIDNLAVSGQHARIIKNSSHYSIEDLGSTNGTFVNNEKTSTTILKENDEISIGKHTLVVAFKKQGEDDGRRAKILDIKRTYKLDTERHNEMLRKQSR